MWAAYVTIGLAHPSAVSGHTPSSSTTSTSMDEEEVLDWGDDIRQNDEDVEDVVSLAGSDDDAPQQPKQEAPETTTPTPAVSTAPSTRTKPSRFSALPVTESLGEKSTLAVPKPPSKSAPRVGPSASLTSIASRTSVGSAAPPAAISTASHPSLPPKPSEEITLAAEAASREDRKRERETMLSAVSLRARAPSPASGDSLPPGWTVRESRKTGEKYFYHTDSGKTSWTKPEPVGASRSRARSLTPPGHPDDERVHDRDDKFKESDSRYDRGSSRRDGGDKDKSREHTGDKPRRRSRSGSPPVRERFPRPRQSDSKRPEKPFVPGAWDRWRPEDDEVDDRNNKIDSDRDRAPRSRQSGPLKAQPSLPHRPTSSYDRDQSPRRGSSRERNLGHESNRRTSTDLKDSKTESRHWGSSRQSPAPESPRASSKRDAESRDHDRNRSPVRGDDRDYFDIEPSQGTARPPASRRQTRGRSRSRTPPPRTPEGRTSRRPQSPSLSTLNHHASHRHPIPSHLPSMYPLPASSSSSFPHIIVKTAVWHRDTWLACLYGRITSSFRATSCVNMPTRLWGV